MGLIDAQVHAWTVEGPDFPWQLNYGSDEQNEQVRRHFNSDIFTHQRVVDAMDAVDVAAGIFVVPGIYMGDITYALEAVRTHPGRFAIVAVADADDPRLDARIREWANYGCVLGVRITGYTDAAFEALHAGPQQRVLDACNRHGLPVNLYLPGHTAALAQVIRSFPDLQIVIDHLGLRQPPVFSEWLTDEPFSGIDELLPLARYANVAVKASGIPSLSRQPFPFDDLWPHLDRVLDAFGLDRVMWGSDFTRVHELVAYSDSVDYIRDSSRLTSAEKAQLMGGTARRVYRWERLPEVSAPHAER